MSNRSSDSQRSHSPSTTPLPSTSSAPQSSMLHVLPAPILRPLSAHYSPHLPDPPRASSPSHFVPPPEPMRAFEPSRGTKRARSEDKEGEDDEHQGSSSGSESSENAEQPVLPAPKKRTRTLMTPDQLTALHRLLSMTRFPTTEQREQCGREIGLSARRVQVWFQNQRQKSKAQQQATSSSSAGGPHVPPRSSGPYQVFSYNTSHYEPQSRPYTSPHPYPYDELPLHHYQVPATSPAPRRSSRLGYHRRGTSSLSYSAASTSARHEYPPVAGGYLLPPYAVEDADFAHAPAYYEPQRSPPVQRESRSPEISRHAPRDDTLAPLWPENESYGGPGSSRGYSSSSDVLNPIVPPRPGSNRPALLPTGLPPPQPLEPTPLWSHPHTNPRYMRPLPPTSSMPSLLGGLNRGRARSDPPISSLVSRPPRPSLGLGLQLHGIRDSANPDEAHEDALTSPARTASDPIGLRTTETTGSRAASPQRRTHTHAHTHAITHSRRSSHDSRDQD